MQTKPVSTEHATESTLCNVCSDGLVEGEAHFLLHCNNLYDVAREILFDKDLSLNRDFATLSDVDKFFKTSTRC